jgi:urea carboxylase-associated protein 1
MNGTTSPLTESKLEPAHAVYDRVVMSGEGWTRVLELGQVFRIVDVEGNQAVDTLFYDAHDTSDRYSAVDTVREQGNIYLSTGSRLLSTEGNTLVTIIADTCGRHDTLGGACAAESNQVRYALDKKYMHNCRDTFLLTVACHTQHMSKRDLTANVNFFMNVPVSPDGKLSFEDGISGSGRYVEMRAERAVRVVISNCPQLNNPCNAYNPTPIRLLIWNANPTTF